MLIKLRSDVTEHLSDPTHEKKNIAISTGEQKPLDL